MVSHTDIKGTHSSKIFEYLACKKPVLICPSDNDVLEEVIQKTNAGYICNSKEDVVVLLRQLVSEFLSAKKIAFNSNISEIEAFTRKNQTKILSDIFEKIPVKQNNPDQPDLPKLTPRDRIFKIIYNSSINNILYRKNLLKKNTLVLCFHNISEHKSISYPHLNTKIFEDLIKYIVKHYNVIPIEEIGTSVKNNKPSIVITFDDGYMDFYENALPILVKYKLPALNNVIVESVETGRPFWSLELNNALDFIFKNDCYLDFSKLGIKLNFQYQDKQNFEHVSIKLLKQLSTIENIKRTVFIDTLIGDLKKYGYSSKNLLMNWDNLSSCISNGVSVGSHTMSHDSLTSIIDPIILEKELSLSKELLEQKLKTKVNTLAFPNGFYNESIINHAKNHYRYLLNTKESYYNPVTDDHGNYFLLPRISMNKRTFEENVLKLNNFHNIVKLNF
jgi:peptidoglycan/xylan/chitin deacetylase (PgdA/CDA1 family)